MNYLLIAGHFNVILYWLGAVFYGYLAYRLSRIKNGIGSHLIQWSSIALFVACFSWGALRTLMSCGWLSLDWVCALMTFPLIFVLSIGIYLIAAVHKLARDNK